MKQERKNVGWMLTVSFLASSSCVRADDYKFAEKHPDGTTDIRAPFVHIDVRHKTHGTRNISVDAPWTHVNSPAEGDNVQVSAPFTKVNPKGQGNVHVSAPFTKVTKQPDGSVHASAPFTEVNKPTTKETVHAVTPPANGH